MNLKALFFSTALTLSAFTANAQQKTAQNEESKIDLYQIAERMNTTNKDNRVQPGSVHFMVYGGNVDARDKEAFEYVAFIDCEQTEIGKPDPNKITGAHVNFFSPNSKQRIPTKHYTLKKEGPIYGLYEEVGEINSNGMFTGKMVSSKKIGSPYTAGSAFEMIINLHHQGADNKQYSNPSPRP